MAEASSGPFARRSLDTRSPDLANRIAARRCDVDEALQIQISRWLYLWRVPELGDELHLSFSRRLRRSLGRCRPEVAEIRLAAWLLEAPRSILEEVVCHELAHAASFALHGAGKRPHGPEWQALMRQAGFMPRAKLPSEAIPATLRTHTEPRLPYLHRCPTCNACRNGRRAREDWRCSRCLAAGGSGRLVIERQLVKSKRIHA